MLLNFSRNPIWAPAQTPALKSALRRCLAALLPLAALVCLAAPAWAQAVTPNASDAAALARIKSVNDTNGQLTGNNWTPPPPATTYDNSNGVTWDGANPGAQVTGLGLSFKQLTGKLDATGMAALTNLNASYNQLTGLDVSQNTALTDLNAEGNQLTSLDVSKNPALATLYAGFNQLTSLDVSQNTALTDLNAGFNQLTSLDVSQNTALTDLNAEGNQLTSLDVTKNPALATLYAGFNQLTSLDVSKNTLLTYLSADNNQLTSLDVTKNPALADLQVYNNQLTSLDVTKNALLTRLDVYNNQLASLDVTKNPALASLQVYNNHLTSLDVTKNALLTRLDVYNNQLTSLDVTKNIALQYLYANNNQLTSLDVTKNPALRILNTSNNQLTSLDVSQNPALIVLSTSSNHLTNLDVSQNPALQILEAGSNQLAGLDVSNNTLLTDLRAPNNRLAGLDVSNNTLLTDLRAPNNRLAGLDVSNNPALRILDVSGNPLNALNLTGLNSLTTLGIAETNLQVSGLNLPNPGLLTYLQVDPAQLAQENFSALTGLTGLGIYHRTAADVTLASNAGLAPGRITYLDTNIPQARSLDFSNYAPGLTTLSIGAGRLERISGAAKLDNTKFASLIINNNRLPLSQIAPLASAVDLNIPLTEIKVSAQSKVWFESQSASNKAFDLAAQLAPERSLLGKSTVFRLLPASAVVTYADGSVNVAANQALKEGVDYTLSADGKLTIAKSGKYYLLMTNPALLNKDIDTTGEIMSLSGLLQYLAGPVDPIDPVDPNDPNDPADPEPARTYAELAAMGGNPNALRLARTLDWAMANGKANALQDLLEKIDNAATDGEALYYLGQMHGESTASAVQYFAFNMKNLFRVVDGFAMTPGDNVILSGVDSAAVAASAPGAGDGDYAAHLGQPWRVKLRLTGDWSNMDGHDGYYGYDGRSFGGALALERDITEGSNGRFTLGFAGAFSHSEVDFDNYDNQGDSDDWAMAVYGRYQCADWFAGARIGYGQSAASVERKLPTLGLTANSNPDIDYYSAALFTGYDFYFGDGSWRLTPVAGVNWLRASADSFDETGAGDYNLSYDADDYDSLELIANVTLAKRIELSSGAALTPPRQRGRGL